MAEEKEQDLVEIAPQAKPPVCKIINYGKFRYEQQKRDKLQRKNQSVSILKEIRFHPNTDVHDFEFKAKHAINFLNEGNKVKATVRFKGREMAYKEQGSDLFYTQCDSLLIGDKCGAHTVPYVEVRNASSKLEHEATTSRIGEDQLFYCRQRGLSEEDAVSLIVNGFAKQVLKELPMEFAVEAQKLLGVSLEGAVG